MWGSMAGMMGGHTVSAQAQSTSSVLLIVGLVAAVAVAVVGATGLAFR
jgi:nitrate reductase NapE component